ncbi:hypothetical protein WH390_09530 [Candidatus Arsenophonus nilaparvatae]|uniref:hypothetical protein n=1 Tax=Candidatus Arsenophonus nilaparvatae TaxID=1247023 RepID=UPI0005098092|nr:hypothetical protein [Candidatus Arsenophonus nilaparvatae]
MLNSTSQIGNYSSQIVNQQVASAQMDTTTNTENKLSSQLKTVGNSSIDLLAVKEKENDLFEVIKSNEDLLIIANTSQSTEQADRFYRAGLAVGIVNDFSTTDIEVQIDHAKIKTNNICGAFPVENSSIENQSDDQKAAIKYRGIGFVKSLLSVAPSTPLDSTVYAQALNIGSVAKNGGATDSTMVKHFSTMWNVRDGLYQKQPHHLQQQ